MGRRKLHKYRIGIKLGVGGSAPECSGPWKFSLLLAVVSSGLNSLA
jgi:hypothetical protein